MLKPLCCGLSSRLCSKQGACPQHPGHATAEVTVPAARDTQGGDRALWECRELAARKCGGRRDTGADSARGCLYSNSSTVGQVEACVQDRQKGE